MFGVVHAFLFAAWVFVLNDKIQHVRNLFSVKRELHLVQWL
jgi:hypothetical protein